VSTSAAKHDNILDRITAHKREEVQLRQALRPLREVQAALDGLPRRRPFGPALRSPGEVALIAEIKSASPSRGVIRSPFDPAEIAGQYTRAGAAAISVLTDKRFFGGAPEYLALVRKASPLPLLMKDFIVSDYQIYEARALGADAVLLIASVLTGEQLSFSLQLARELGLACLVEAHDREELEEALQAGADIVGINNRNLKTFTTSLDHTFELMPLLKGTGVAVVSESGIKTRADMLRLQDAGVHAALVGETLMAAPDPGAAARQLLGRAGQAEVTGYAGT